MTDQQERMDTSCGKYDCCSTVIPVQSVSTKPTKVVRPPARFLKHHIPAEILENAELNAAIAQLPPNYNFELHKTIWRVKSTAARRVALQFPEGLLLFALPIADIIARFTDAEPVVMADVTYGACCVDDYTARALECDLMIHYGHSCLVPVTRTSGIQMLYVFVDIQIDTPHLLATIRHNFEAKRRLAFVSTVQFIMTLQVIQKELAEEYDIVIPQCKPLSPGEVLGCTAPKLPDGVDALIYLGDGRFHLEAAMIANPKVKAYQYDPYSQKLTAEAYEYDKMCSLRSEAVQKAAGARCIGLILSTLGRQGNPKILDNLRSKIHQAGKESIVVLMSEIFPDRLKKFAGVDCWVQVACPRLSIDWGLAFAKPLLTPYELAVSLRQIDWQNQYPMDFYANNSLGDWTNNHESNRPPRPVLKTRV